jgi:predicted transcriptional regulator
MKLTKILMAGILSVTVASASDVMKKSMAMMQSGIEQVQSGFINNSADSIKEGLKQIEKGNALFSEKEVIAKYLPKDKKHMVNTAVNASKRIQADTTIIDLNLDDKAYIKAAQGYSDMLNACSKCHGLIRSW